MKREQDFESLLFDLVFPIMEYEPVQFLLSAPTKLLIAAHPQSIVKIISNCAQTFYEDDIISQIWDCLEDNARASNSKMFVKLFALDLLNAAETYSEISRTPNLSQEEIKELFFLNLSMERLMMLKFLSNLPLYVGADALSDEIVKDYANTPEKYLEEIVRQTSTFKRIELWEYMCKSETEPEKYPVRPDFYILVIIMEKTWKQLHPST